MTSDQAIRKVNLSIQKKIWEYAEAHNLPHKEKARDLYLNLLGQVEQDEKELLSRKEETS